MYQYHLVYSINNLVIDRKKISYSKAKEYIDLLNYRSEKEFKPRDAFYVVNNFGICYLHINKRDIVDKTTGEVLTLVCYLEIQRKENIYD